MTSPTRPLTLSPDFSMTPCPCCGTARASSGLPNPILALRSGVFGACNAATSGRFHADSPNAPVTSRRSSLAVSLKVRLC